VESVEAVLGPSHLEVADLLIKTAEVYLVSGSWDNVSGPLERALEIRQDKLGEEHPTVARALIAAGHATSVEDAFKRLLSWGSPAYVPRTGMGPSMAISTIRAAGGLPVLAHFAEAPARIEVVRELVDEGLAGLEVYYRTFDVASVAAVGVVADSLGLLKTGGSDYHGDLGTYAETYAGLWVPPEVGLRLEAALAEAAHHVQP
jgi:predicted metal-dependent phosphoesterase TrpH